MNGEVFILFIHEDDVCDGIAGVAPGSTERAIAHLKQVAYGRRHPRGGKNQLKWEWDKKLAAFISEGAWDCQWYEIKRYEVTEVQ